MSDYTNALKRRIEDLERRVAALEGERVNVHAHLHLDKSMIEEAVRREVQGISPWHGVISPDKERHIS